MSQPPMLNLTITTITTGTNINIITPTEIAVPPSAAPRLCLNVVRSPLSLAVMVKRALLLAQKSPHYSRVCLENGRMERRNNFGMIGQALRSKLAKYLRYYGLTQWLPVLGVNRLSLKSLRFGTKKNAQSCMKN